VFSVTEKFLGKSHRNLLFGLVLSLSGQLIGASEKPTELQTRVAKKHSQQALLESQMEAYNLAVSEEFKGLLRIELQRSILNELRLVKSDQRSRG
tara:strand:+ start:11544 stop:11828 length:285 start_codon:yes stop_codon:yes gene_type:complete